MLVSQGCRNPSGNFADRTLDIGFVLGSAHSGRENRHVVMLCKFVIVSIQLRGIPVTLFAVNGCRAVVRNQNGSNPAEVGIPVNMSFDPVCSFLV